VSDEKLTSTIQIRYGMRWKLVVVMVSMMMTLVVLLTALQVSAQKDSLNNALSEHSSFLETQMHRQANKATNTMSAHIERLIATKQLRSANDFIRNVVRDIDDLRYVILMHGNQPQVAIGSDLNPTLKQHILSGNVSAFAAQQTKVMHHDFTIDDHGFMETVMPIMLLDKQWGVLRLGFSVDQLNANLTISQQHIDAAIKSALTRAILTSLLFLILGALGIYYFAHRWTDPLKKLVHFSHELAGGDFSATAHISTRGDDEIGLLVTALEEMADSLKKSYAQLEEHSHTLEDQVEKRTRELAEARDSALAATRAKSDFLANMSHEIRTPMNAVIGMTHLALEDAHNEKQRTYLNNIHAASATLLALINDILDFSKIEAGKLHIDAVNFHLADILSNSSNVIGLTANEKGLDLVFDYPADLPPLYGDSLRLGQVLLNLINNAVKFTEHGQVKVSVQVIKQSDSNIELYFEVRDSGIGMSRKQQKNLFQAFSQADTSITRKYGGTGLGLAICKQLIELMHGEIGVTSKPGKGSVFHFRICFEIGNADGMMSGQTTQSIPADAITALQGARLLLVEDNEINQQVAEGLLSQVGVSVVIAEHGKQALQRLQYEDFDGVLMDMQMPVMDGLEATRLIRTDPKLHDLPIIAMTANAMLGDRDKCLQAGMNDHVSKPVDPGLLYVTLMRWIKPAHPPAIEPALNNAIEKQSDGETQPSRFGCSTDGSTDGSSDASTDRSIDFSNIAGIDAKAGLNMVVGNQALYQTILGKFHASQALSLQEIQTALAANNRSQAIHLAHTLKGVSGNIGASKLHNAAATLETALMQNDAPINQKLLNNTLTQLNEVVDGIARWKERNQPEQNKPSAGTADASAVITEMRALLHEYNADAVNMIDALESALADMPCSSHISQLRQHLSAYDFDAALESLDQIELIRSNESDRMNQAELIRPTNKTAAP